MNKKVNLLLSNSKGFSLLEVLIAITILAFISIAIGMFTDSSISTAIKVTNEDIESLQIETAMSRLEWDVSHAYSPLYYDHAMEPAQLTPQEGEFYNQLVDYYQNNARFAFVTYFGHPVPINQHPEKTELIFYTIGNRRKVQDIKQSHFAWVKYELLSEEIEQQEDLPQKTFALARKVYAKNIYGADEIDWEQVKTQILMHKITKLRFEFWNPETNKWGDNLEVIKNGNHLLRGIKLTLQYLDPENVEVTAVRVFRPLFPNFIPENMYKFLKPKKKEGTPQEGEVE